MIFLRLLKDLSSHKAGRAARKVSNYFRSISYFFCFALVLDGPLGLWVLESSRVFLCSRFKRRLGKPSIGLKIESTNVQCSMFKYLRKE